MDNHPRMYIGARMKGGVMDIEKHRHRGVYFGGLEEQIMIYWLYSKPGNRST